MQGAFGQIAHLSSLGDGMDPVSARCAEVCFGVGDVFKYSIELPTARGFEPRLAEATGFRVYLLSRSDTRSTNGKCFALSMMVDIFCFRANNNIV